MASKLPDEEEEAYPNLQNQYQSHGDSWLIKILLRFSSVYKATKCLLQKLCLVFNFLSPRKTAAPLLSIRNPASTAVSQPLLHPSPSPSSSSLICSPNHSSSLSISSGIDDDAGHCENEMDHGSLVSETDEIKCSDTLISVSYDEIVQAVLNCLCSREEEREEDVKVQVKNIVGVDEKERRIKHYKSSHKILLVGEGDFSFSACLALAFVSAPNIIATSLNSKAYLKKHYGKAMSNIAELRSRGSKVMHGIDATEIANHELLRHFKFDRIIFNFPFAGFFHKLSTEDQLRHHRRLVSLFLKNAKELISENGEIHISNKTNGFHAEFKLENIASSHGLRLIQAVKFNSSHYPGYHTKYGYGGDRNFDWNPSKTFKFALKTVKNIVGVDEKERKIKHYKSSHKILLVGEGDFSFSACLALAFVSAPNIIATSLNSKAFLKKHYGKAMSNIRELRSRGSKVMHGIDATEIANHELLRHFKFDRIIFNFPFAGFFHKLSTKDQLRRHRRLVSLFLKNAKELISENGEIHISHKTNGFHADFKLESIASSHGLRLIQAVKFNLSHYPGYDTKFGFGGDDNFNCYPSKTFKFALK